MMPPRSFKITSRSVYSYAALYILSLMYICMTYEQKVKKIPAGPGSSVMTAVRLFTRSVKFDNVIAMQD